jgi:hypothetical protein
MEIAVSSVTLSTATSAASPVSGRCSSCRRTDLICLEAWASRQVRGDSCRRKMDEGITLAVAEIHLQPSPVRPLLGRRSPLRVHSPDRRTRAKERSVMDFTLWSQV